MLILKTTLILVPLCAALPAFSQTGGEAPSNAPSASDNSGSNGDQVAHGDRVFAMKLATGSTNEVALSQLADSRAASADVKSFAQMMIQDHGKLNAQLSDLCQRKGLDISKAVQRGQEKGVSDLSDKQGQDFDSAYVKIMVKNHKQAQELLQKEIQDSKDQDFVALANQALPVVQHHLEMAEQLDQKINP